MQENTKQLVYSILIDAIGMITFIFPLLGEAGDIAWALISALLVRSLYRNNGLAAFNFVEEALPGTDFIPTATIGWLYYNYAKKKQ